MAARVPPPPPPTPGARPPGDPGGAGWTRVAATGWLAATESDAAGRHDDRAAGARRAARAAQDFLARAFPVPTPFRTPTLAHALGPGLPAPEALRRVVGALAGRVAVANPVGAARLPWALREGARVLVRDLLAAAGATPPWLRDGAAAEALAPDPRAAAEGRRARALLLRALGLDAPGPDGAARVADATAAARATCAGAPVRRVACLLDERAPDRLALHDGWRGDPAAPLLAGRFAYRLTIVLAGDDAAELPAADAPGGAHPWPVPHALPRVSQRTVPRRDEPWAASAAEAPEDAPAWASGDWHPDAAGDGDAEALASPDAGRGGIGGAPRVVAGEWFAARLLVPEPWLLPRLAPGDVGRWLAHTRGAGAAAYWAPEAWEWLLERPGGRVVTPDLVGRAVRAGASPAGAPQAGAPQAGALALSPAVARGLAVPPGWALLAADAALLVRVRRA